MLRRLLPGIVCLSACLAATVPVAAAKLHVGAASASITPDVPVALLGQRHTRISKEVETPCIATVLALESRDGDRSLEQAVFVACDLVFIPHPLRDAIVRRVQERVAGFDAAKLILSATHTHTAPVMIDGIYTLPSEGIMQPKEYVEFAADRISAAVAEAWKQRAPGSAGWGLGHAVVARNRLAVYADGKAQMYGAVDKPDFHRFEGYEDHGVEVLFFWDDAGKLIASAVNVACPAQEVENRYAVNADFWHPVREKLRKQHGEDIVVLGWTGPGGDQSPHALLRKPAEARMLELRQITSMDAIADRIVFAWEEAFDGAQHDKHAEPVLAHRIETIALPKRQVTQEQYLEAKTKAAQYAGKPEEAFNQLWHGKVVERFETQKPTDVYEMTLHVVRLGDTAIATNDFELYTDYGVRMKALSPAIQTFCIQLCGPGSYLPADRSIAGGAYGSVVQSGTVGPDGGNVLVEKTVAAINALFPKKK